MELRFLHLFSPLPISDRLRSFLLLQYRATRHTKGPYIMEDTQTLLTKAKTASAKLSYYSRILAGRDIDGEAERFLCKKLRRRLFFVLLYFSLSLLFGLTELFFAATPLGLALFSATTGMGAIASLLGLLLAAAFLSRGRFSGSVRRKSAE